MMMMMMLMMRNQFVCLQLQFPPHFSVKLKQLIGNLLQNDMTYRFGNMQNGADDIKNCEFFSALNWLALSTQEVRSPRSRSNKQLKTKQNKKLCHFDFGTHRPMVIAKGGFRRGGAVGEGGGKEPCPQDAKHCAT